MKTIAIIFSLMLIFTSNSLLSKTITGSVYDSDGNPLPGVSIVIKGSAKGAVSDINGFFSIEVNDDNAILLFQYVGYINEEVKIMGRSNFDVHMIEDVSELNEVVVTGYGVQQKSNLTGSVSTITFNNSSVDQALQGRTAGVKIRGVSSCKKYNSPVSDRDISNEGYSKVNENGYKTPKEMPLSTFSIDVDAASYSNMRRFIQDGMLPPSDAVRVEEMINYFSYDYPQPEGNQPFEIITELGECPWNKDNKLLHIGLQGKKFESEEMPASNLVFLIDVSGSMSSENKLPLLKKAFKLLVSQLRAEDKVAIVVYAGSSGLILPSTNGDEKETILAALDRLQSGGSTAGAAGLKLAYQTAECNYVDGGNNRIILATDGDFNVGPSSNNEMEDLITKYRDKGIFISVAGFGMGNYKDDKMEIIADKGNGNYSYIDNLMEAKKVFVNEFSSTLYTIAKDVKIQIEFNPAYVAEYRLVGYENRLLDEKDFDNDKKDAGEMGAGHTVTALYEIVPVGGKHAYKRNLKYQKEETAPIAEGNGEFATIKFRYKKPDGDRSILIEKVIPNKTVTLDNASNNFKFSASVAGFGMLLRNSEYKGENDYDKILDLARESKGNDTDGYRSEFINLVELAKHL
jgi:Ca-activated chloride channel homolog